MTERIITGIILVAVFLPLLLLSHTLFFLFVMALISAVAAYEMLHCLKADKIWPIAIPSYFIALAFPLSARLIQDKTGFAPWVLAIIIVYLLWLNVYCVLRRDTLEYSLCSSVFMSVIYVTAGFTSLVLLRDTVNGQYIFWLVFVGAWVTDTMAYFSGMLFGKHKLIEEVSPKKTVEGAIGGTLFCGLSFALFGYIVSLITDVKMSLLMLFFAGLIAAVVSQFGDLSASIIKRQNGIKDYGKLFPGHGGVMDRFDSIVALAPVMLVLHAFSFFAIIR